jgi:type I restriction enzyme R subunit
VSGKLGGEKHAVQNPLIKYVKEPRAEYEALDGNKVLLNLGWQYVDPEEALRLRGGNTGFVFRQLFIDRMQKLNPDFIDASLAEELIKRLERIPPNIEGNLVAWEHLKGLKTVFVPAEKRERNVKFIDAENIDANAFHVTDELEFSNGSRTIRADVVFLINGVPLFFVETKAAHKIEGMAEALNHIRRYHRECPELMAMLQVYALTHIIRYYYSATWNLSEKTLFNWKEAVTGDFETLVKTFFDRERVVRMVNDFILFTRQDDELKKVLLRPHQMRAVNRLLERAQDKEKRRGLIWHTQGSGKTYTMIVTAQKILENPIFEKPTVIMLVDRNELEAQLFGNLDAIGVENVKVAESKEDLKQLLERDTRGLIVTMIHKFEGIPEKVNLRENIFVLVDEAHRTTGGKLGNYLMGALPNATYIGFTGTPIDRTVYGQGTFVTFGQDDPPNGYLDKYSIGESIEDGTTVPLHYTLAPNELQVDKETLEKEFLALKELEGVSDIEEVNKVLERAVNLRNMLKNKERMSQVAKYVADHYEQHIEPLGYKAFLVAVDREACALYKKELDKHLPSDYSAVVYSPFYNDPEELAEYHLTEEAEKRVRKAFRNPKELPKILIVTEKLLTGFDAPVLYCMYLDKPMRDHVLLQAIARVNRPYEDEEGRKKPSGFVLDFVGIFGNLEKALAFDSKDIEGVVRDIGVLRQRFQQLMDSAGKGYLQLIEGKTQDKAVEAVLGYFIDEEKRHKYYQFFRELSDIYDILSPDAFLRQYIDDMETLARMYRILKEAYDPGISMDKDFSRKTAELVRKHTKAGAIKPTLDVYEINERTLKLIEGKKISDTEKVFNLLKSIEKLVIDQADKSLYLLSIGEKAELIAKLYKERQRSTQETLEALKGIIEEINVARREQAEKDMPPEVFSIFWIFKKEGVASPEDKANQMRRVLEQYPYWKRSEAHEREVKQALYKVLLKSDKADTHKVKELVDKVMRVIMGRAE